MNRGLVGATFALFTVATLAKAVEQAADAFADPSARAWLVAGFWVLKTGIVAVFCQAVLRRSPAMRPAREPVAFAACAAAILGAVAVRGPEAAASTDMLIAGEAVAVLSCGFLLASVLALGTCFGVLPEARGLVTRGPYGLVRHPVYLGELGACAGLVMAAPTAWNLSAAAVLLAGQLVRMRLEERALAREFPEYGSYAARTPKLLPLRGLGPARTSTLVIVVAGGLTVAASATVLAAGSTGKAAHDAAARRLAAPRQMAPADAARVDAVPSFSWGRVKRAAKYEFQLAADPAFRSIVQGQGKGSFKTANTSATVDKTLADGDYFWRVRAINRRDRAGRWSRARSMSKAWASRPRLASPPDGGSVTYPSTPLVLRWDPVPRAFKYVVEIATDPSLAHSALPDRQRIETSGSVFALPGALAPGRYYWAVTPLDGEKHPGTRSSVAAFDWSWPTRTTARVADLNPDARVFDPQFSWDPVPGAAQYQVEVNPSEDWAVGSRVCCDEAAIGTSLSPLRLLPNNTYYWRVRALDTDGNAGDWNVGASFAKGFDDVVPTIPRLRVRDNLADGRPAAGPSGLPTTDAPVVAWDPVPGASSYEVRVVPWDGFCNWSAAYLRAWTATTATTAWTPLAPQWNAQRPLGNAFPTVAYDSGRSLADGMSYCVRVRARSDRDAKFNEIVSDWTQLGGVGHAAFTYEAGAVSPCFATATPVSAYNEPQTARVASQAPLFTWRRVAGACAYYVVVARDAKFTKIVDVALTNIPAYAPRSAVSPATYADETTSYYWAVMPTTGATGNGLSTQPQEDAPRPFEKRSAPPRRLGPSDGGDVTTQASFRWTASEGAREYRIQVDDDPTFGSPIADVLTNSTSYTPDQAFPADTILYWRVRANDENRVGLTWSDTGTFRRRFAVPSPSHDDPEEGDAIPALSWSPVDGAVSYDMHVEQADGTKRDFPMRSTAFTPVAFYGTGIWHWQVRANFKSGFRTVSGGYSGARPFARRIATPTGIRTSRAQGGALLSWEPATMARQYKVQISTSDSFSTIIEQVDTSNTSFAPKMTAPAFASGAPLYWRVAAVDEGNNAGGFAATPLQNERPLRVRLRGKLRRGHKGRVRITVTSNSRRRVAKALVTVSGAVPGARPRRTGRRGTVTLRLRPTKRGKVRIRVEKRGYAPAKVTLRVR